MSRKKIIAGNWKMNKTPQEADALIGALIPAVADADADVVVCVPYTALAGVTALTKNTNIAVGAQNMHFEEKGAFTGEISADMLLALGVKYVIIGHSERRQYFGETDASVNKKTLFALDKGLIPIVCCGESLEQRELGVTNEHVRLQVKAAFQGITAERAAGVVVAYEPIWAIGTGKTATAAQANEVCAVIRGVIGELYGAATAGAVRIQYGGSMNAANAEELLAQSDIDGGLIGGASLKAEDFTAIVKAG
ncbi:MAG: triose-phosphate isomerase [Clostridiales bacterium]|jgi:triosephosphate isomerase|nr:triose-phosphate isomerase [Clostridiales bacterium]